MLKAEVMNDEYKPGDGAKASKRLLIAVIAFLGSVLWLVAYAGRLLGWWR
jgi:hypothetical protein